LRKSQSKVGFLVSCFRNTELISKPIMGGFTIRPLEVKSLGLMLPMQRKSSSIAKMIKANFRENGSKGQNLLRKNQNSLRLKSLF